MSPALSVRDLVVRYGDKRVLDGVSLSVEPGRTLGVVGESGSGKSTLAQVLVGLVKPSAGAVLYDGAPFDPGPRWARRPSPAQIVFQDPQSAFNPRRRVWRLIAEPLEIRGGLTRAALRDRAAELAAQVGLSADQLDRWPHEFSGGQRQRMAIARALATDPRLLILDEPTSALDVSIQAQVLNLLLKLQAQRRVTYVFISHDVPVIRHMADTVVVLEAGRIVEAGPAGEVLGQPTHPYTRALVEAAPVLGARR